MLFDLISLIHVAHVHLKQCLCDDSRIFPHCLFIRHGSTPLLGDPWSPPGCQPSSSRQERKCLSDSRRCHEGRLWCPGDALGGRRRSRERNFQGPHSDGLCSRWRCLRFKPKDGEASTARAQKVTANEADGDQLMGFCGTQRVKTLFLSPLDRKLTNWEISSEISTFHCASKWRLWELPFDFMTERFFPKVKTLRTFCRSELMAFWQQTRVYRLSHGVILQPASPYVQSLFWALGLEIHLIVAQTFPVCLKTTSAAARSLWIWR